MFDAIAANTAKTGITAGQATAITANTAKVSSPINSALTLTITKTARTNALVITDGTHRWTIAAD